MAYSSLKENACRIANSVLLAVTFFIVLAVNLAASGSPASFPLVLLISTICPYLVGLLLKDFGPGPVVVGFSILIAYYFCVIVYRFTYNCHLDPLLAIQGPKVPARLVPLTENGNRDTGHGGLPIFSVLKRSAALNIYITT